MHISKPYVSIDNSNLVNLGSIISLPREITEDVVGLPSKEKKSAKRIIRKRIITSEITCNNNNTSDFLQKLCREGKEKIVAVNRNTVDKFIS